MTAPENLSSWRQQERSRLLALRMAVAPALRHRWNDAITQHLCNRFPTLGQMVIGFYWPFKGEFDPRFAIRHWREAGARVALPVVIEKNAPLVYRQWWPGVATDAAGFRLGYGGGYFDRTLAAMHPQPKKIAVAFEMSRISTIRPQPHDIGMDFVVTELGVYQVMSHGLVPAGNGALA